MTLSDKKSSNVMIQKLNPLTGESGWKVEDEMYDFIQEIARSAFADMLHDSERNEKYYEAIKIAVKQKHEEGVKAHVLDIGTGTGLLAMMAACSGADTIHACEAFSPISKCAEEVIKENGLVDRITVIHKRSTDMIVGDGGDLPRRCNILVTEVFDTELIGEGAIETIYHALTNLLEENCLVVPSGATVYAQVVESAWMQRWNQLSPWGDIMPSQAIMQCPGAAALHDLQLSQVRREDFKVIAEPMPVFRFDWTCKTLIPFEDMSTVNISAVNSGTAEMVFMWWSLDMDPQGKIVLSCAPWWAHPSNPSGPDAIPWRDHWMQAVYYLPSPIAVTEGQTFKLLSSHDEFSMWFNITTKDDVDTEQTKRPVCDCMLHVACSRTRIGMLNDPIRRDKYLKVLQRLVTPESVVMTYGSGSLLSLVVATLGAKQVYQQGVDSSGSSLVDLLMEALIKDNNLDAKVNYLTAASSLTEKERSSVNLVVSEPFFTNAFFPWGSLFQLWLAKADWPGVHIVPASATLYAMPMQFDHLHKIRAPLGTICGFKMTPFDKLIQDSISISDNCVEAHPLWEYPGICLGHPTKIQRLDGLFNFKSFGNKRFDVSGTWHGVAIWVDIHLDAETTVSTGPVEPPVPGKPVSWDPYTRQAVYFIEPSVSVTEQDSFNHSTIFRNGIDDDFKFSFELSRTAL